MLKKRVLPPRLDKTKLVAIVAPADPVSGVCSAESIKAGYDYLKSKGFSIVEGNTVKKITDKHTAGSIEERVNDIHEFFERKDVGCIMAFWGGFNSNQLLDKLDYKLIRNNPKIFIGYSDITALTTAITTKTGLITFSGPGAVTFTKPQPFEYSWEYFEKMCINPTKDLKVLESPNYADDLFFLREDSDHRIIKKNEGIKVYRGGKARGEVVVGNLQTLLVLAGTGYLPKMKNKILFIEEDETSGPAHVDRFLCQCKQLGWFDNIKGLVIGRFTEYSKLSNEYLEDILKNYISETKFPVLYNVDFGHSDPTITIPNGGIVKIDADLKEIIFEKSVR